MSLDKSKSSTSVYQENEDERIYCTCCDHVYSTIEGSVNLITDEEINNDPNTFRTYYVGSLCRVCYNFDYFQIKEYFDRKEVKNITEQEYINGYNN